MHLEDIAAMAPRQSIPFSSRSEVGVGRPHPEPVHKHRHSLSYESMSRLDFAPPLASSLPSTSAAALAASYSSSSSYLQAMSIGSPQSQDAFAEYRGRTSISGDQALSPRLRGS